MSVKPPVLGIPLGTKQAGQRVDFKADWFDLLVETKGYLLAWSRASVCPCISKIEQSNQADPNCILCKGKGWLYFKSPEIQDLSEYTFTELQQFIITDSNSMIIKGVITGIENKQDNLDKLSNWVDGSARLTVRPENKLGYLDKIIGLDCAIVYTENKEANGTDIIVPRYPIVEINQIRSESTIFVLDTDYEINNEGKIHWLGSVPIQGTILALHYLCNPIWLIITHPHTARVTSKLLKNPTPKTPTGDARDLVTQAIILYDFLVE